MDEHFEENGNKYNKIISKILLVVLGIALTIGVGGMLYKFYLQNEEIKNRTKMYIEAGGTLSGGEYVVSDGGYIESKDNDVIEVKNDGTIVGKNGGTTTIEITKDSDDENLDYDGNPPKKQQKKQTNNKITDAYDELDEGESVEIEVTVEQKVSSIALDRTDINLYVGEVTFLKANILPETATNKNVTWSSSNSNVVSVKSNGEISANSVGVANITVTSKDNGKKANCKVTVVNKNVIANKIYLVEDKTTLNVGDNKKINPVVTPDSSLTKAINFSSSNSNVASVDQNGNISARSEGTAIINMSVPGENLTAKYTVIVKSVAVVNFVVSPSSVELEVGKSAILTTTVYPVNATNKNVTYISSDNTVASVDSNGIIIAKKAGNCSITVSSNNGKKVNVNVKVKETIIPVSRVSATLSNGSITIGQSTTIKTVVEPSNATNKNVTYASSDSGIASVNSSGVVTGVKAGTATISVTSSNGIKTNLVIKVNGILVKKINLSSTNLSLTTGATEKLSVKSIEPSNASNKGVKYTSNNPSVATVTSDGVIVANKAGSAVISVTSLDGGASSSCNVKVSDVSIKSFNLSSSSANLVVGGTTSLTVKNIAPANATNKSVTWSSSNNKIATVDNSGNVKAIKEGKVTITATANDGSGVNSSATINVSKIDVNSVSLSNERVIVEVGSTDALTASIKPKNATYQSVKWSSSDTKVATVSSSGVVTGKKMGKATITATVDGVKTSIPVYVTAKGDKVYYVDIQDYDYYIGDCIIIESTNSNGNKVYGMIDTGKSGKASYKRIISYLNDMGITKLNWVLLTHFHSDHVGGLTHLYDAGIKISAVYTKEYIGLDSNYANSYSSVNDMRTKRKESWNSMISKIKSNSELKYVTSSANNSFKLGNFKFKLYNTNNVYKDLGSVCKSTASCNENSNSLVALGTVNGKNFYFSGDIQDFSSKVKKATNNVYTIANTVMTNNKLSKIDVFKVAHHGITANNPQDALTKLKPSYAVTTNLKWYVNDKHSTIDRLKTAGVKADNILFSGNGTVSVNVNSSKTISVLQFNGEGCNGKKPC